MNQTEHIAKMERHLNEAGSTVREMYELMERFQRIQPAIRELSSYYGSAEWFRDLNDYNEGKLPEDLRCGVLSEDLIWNLLTESRELAEMMRQTANDILKDERSEGE